MLVLPLRKSRRRLKRTALSSLTIWLLLAAQRLRRPMVSKPRLLWLVRILNLQVLSQSANIRLENWSTESRYKNWSVQIKRLKTKKKNLHKLQKNLAKMERTTRIRNRPPRKTCFRKEYWTSQCRAMIILLKSFESKKKMRFLVFKSNYSFKHLAKIWVSL